MLVRSKGRAHYQSRKHDNFDIGRDRVQISVSNEPLWLLEKSNLFVLQIQFCLMYFYNCSKHVALAMPS